MPYKAADIERMLTILLGFSSPVVASGVAYIGCANTFAAFHLPGTTP